MYSHNNQRTLDCIVTTPTETMEDLRLRGEVDTQTMWVASDGSALDSHTEAIWAWHLLNKIGEKYT